MISSLATVVTRCVFPHERPARSTQPGSHLPYQRESAPAVAVAPSTRPAPPILFRQQDALLALLTEIARRRLEGSGAGR